MKLKVKDISKNYNRYSALRGVNLELEPGLYGLLGPNGAGKSTLLKIIAGILRPTAGSILLDNEPVSKLGEHYRAMLGYMPQDLGIYPEFTAKRYLLYIAALKGLTEAQAKAEIDKLLEAVGLSSNAEQKLKGFSGGMLRRVGIAQTLLCNPQILLLDEPTAGLDPQERVRLRNLLSALAQHSIELACRQTKTLHMMTSNERDVKNTLISIATYAKALKSEGANLYSFVEDVDAVGIIEAALRSANITENSLRTYWGENLYTFVNTSNVFAPLIEALQKTHSGTMDVRSIVVCAANAFESFLADFAVRKGVSLSGRNGILQKRDALSAHISKKHRGMIEFVGQVRNAADHGADPDENNQVWTISNETARIYPCIIAALIKAIFSRDATGSIEV